MRGHKNKNSSKGKKRVIKAEIGFEGGGLTGYGLRENPKKSLKFSAQEIVCKVCGNWFKSPKALFGHMRCHSGTAKSGIFCKECGEGFESVMALTTHMKIHSARFDLCNESWTHSSQQMEVESQSNSGTKRSNRRGYAFRRNHSSSNLDESVSFTEAEQEVEEVAVCLMMLSRGAINWGGFSSIAESSENDSVTFEVRSPGEKKRIVYDNEVLRSLKMKKPRYDDTDSRVSHSDTVSSQMSEFEYGNDSGLEISAEEIELEAPVDESRDGMKKDNLEGMKMNPSEEELDEGFTGDNGLRPAISGSLKSGLNNKTSSDFGTVNNSLKKSEYKCKTCNKNFHSYQALGGHQTIHRTRNSSDQRILRCRQSSSSSSVPETESNFKLLNLECSKNSPTKEYSCDICFKVFASGQALGGHKRSHLVKNSKDIAEETLEVNQQASDICDVEVDLNLPVILEEETVVDVGFRSLKVRDDQKHELMVL